MAQLLLDNGADPHATWIHIVAIRGHTDVLRMLVDYGGDTEGVVAHAICHGQFGVARKLLQWGAIISPSDTYAMDAAVKLEDVNMVQYLFDELGFYFMDTQMRASIVKAHRLGLESMVQLLKVNSVHCGSRSVEITMQPS